MCNVIEIELNDMIVHISDIKREYIENIVDAAKGCKIIDRIIVFGSSITEHCTEESDIDLAIFGNVVPSRAYRSAEYRNFQKKIYSKNNHKQSYDMLYFKTGGKQRDHRIMDEIDGGQRIYEKRQ